MRRAVSFPDLHRVEEKGSPVRIIPTVLQDGGMWLLWTGIGLNASLSSAEAPWWCCQLCFFIFFTTWCYYHVNAATVVRSIFFFIVELFFKDFDVAGAVRVPTTGPVILVCAPHNNQFLDSLVVFKAIAHREDIGFIAAAKTLRRKWVGRLAKVLDPIPVERPQDLAKIGRGSIIINGTTVTGKSTEFREYVSPGDLLVLKTDTVRIKEVVSDTELILKSSLSNTHLEPSSFKIHPRLDQSKMFEDVFKRLKVGSAVGIFPEGGSHDRTQLLPLKMGVTSMALGAMSQNPDLNVTIVPVGINYFKGHRFRCRVFVDIGKPFIPNHELVDAYAAGGEQKRTACKELMSKIQYSLQAVTIKASDFATLQFFRAIRRFYTDGPVDAARRFEIMQRFSSRYEKQKNEPDVKQLYRKVSDYRRLLSHLRVTDYKIANMDVGIQLVSGDTLLGSDAIHFLVRHVLYLLVFGLLSIPGMILASPMILATRYISNMKAKEALAGSRVKLKGQDVVATWKIMIAMVMVPLMHILYTTLTYIFFGRTVSVVYFFFSPSLAGAAVWTSEKTKQYIGAIRPLIAALKNKQAGTRLINMRKDLVNLVQEVVQKRNWDAPIDD